MIRITLEAEPWDAARALEVTRRVVEDLRTVPGVHSVGVLGNVLVSGQVSNGSVTVDGERVFAYWNRIDEETLLFQASILMAAAAVLAASLPALRAARTDAVEVLSAE